MKVKCIQLLDEETGAKIEHSSWLRVNTIYHVLSVYISKSQVIKLRIIGSDGVTPAFHAIEQFEVVSNVIPSNWAIDFSQGNLQLAPKPWLTEHFWEKYFEFDQNTVAIFEEEQVKILKEDP